MNIWLTPDEATLLIQVLDGYIKNWNIRKTEEQQDTAENLHKHLSSLQDPSVVTVC